MPAGRAPATGRGQHRERAQAPEQRTEQRTDSTTADGETESTASTTPRQQARQTEQRRAGSGRADEQTSSGKLYSERLPDGLRAGNTTSGDTTAIFFGSTPGLITA